MGKKKVTFADIAKYTNFSKTTISRYFNSPDSLTLENQEKIAKALDDLGYQENKLAKVLANGKSAKTAMELLILQMDEMKKRRPTPLEHPIHKQITPVLIRRETTDS